MAEEISWKRWFRTNLPRGVILAVLVGFISLILPSIWKHFEKPIRPTATEVPKTTPPAPVAPQSSAPESSTPQPKPKREQPKTKIEQHGAGNGAVGGNIQQGPCSNLQIGGNKNQATVNCGPQLAISRFPDDKIEELTKLLPVFPSVASVRIGVKNPDGMTNRDAVNLLAAFAKTGFWSTAGVDTTIGGNDIGPNGPIPDPTGIHIRARSERFDLAQSVRNALIRFGIAQKSVFVDRDESITSEDVNILVGASQ